MIVCSFAFTQLIDSDVDEANVGKWGTPDGQAYYGRRNLRGPVRSHPTASAAVRVPAGGYPTFSLQMDLRRCQRRRSPSMSLHHTVQQICRKAANKTCTTRGDHSRSIHMHMHHQVVSRQFIVPPLIQEPARLTFVASFM